MNRVTYAMQVYRPPGKKKDDPAFAKGLVLATQILPDGIDSPLHALAGDAEFRRSVTIVSTSLNSL